jgi:hypothetical protein
VLSVATLGRPRSGARALAQEASASTGSAGDVGRPAWLKFGLHGRHAVTGADVVGAAAREFIDWRLGLQGSAIRSSTRVSGTRPGAPGAIKVGVLLIDVISATAPIRPSRRVAPPSARPGPAPIRRRGRRARSRDRDEDPGLAKQEGRSGARRELPDEPPAAELARDL